MHRNVGEAYVVYKFNRNSKSKLEHGGTMYMWQRNSKDHQADVCLILNIKTQNVDIACGVKWLTRIYGKWKGDSDVEDVMVDASKSGMSNEDNYLDELNKKGYVVHDTCSKVPNLDKTSNFKDCKS